MSVQCVRKSGEKGERGMLSLDAGEQQLFILLCYTVQRCVTDSREGWKEYRKKKNKLDEELRQLKQSRSYGIGKW